MGNNRFKLSELIPNAWFYKLREMGGNGKSKKLQRQPNSTASSSPATNKLHALPTPTPPTRSSTLPKTTPSGSRLRRRPTVDSKSSTTSGHSTATGTGSFSPEFRSDQVLLPDDSLTSSSTFTPPPELDLRPIITKPVAAARKTTVSTSPAGVRLRLRSPRISTRKSVSSSARRSGCSARRSRAVVKASVDPWRDFKESMEEMICENNIRASKDLEELLACYLCLNSDQYHSIIISVFKQLWLDLHFPPPP